MNVPVRLFFNAAGTILACSMASHDTLSTSRCWGSIAQRLARADAEEPRVEPVHVVEEAALPDEIGTRTECLLRFPVPVRRRPGNGVPARRHQLPEVSRGPYAAGKPAGHSDNRDGLVRGRLGLLRPDAGPAATRR